MKLPNTLSHGGIAGLVPLTQILGLIFEMVEAGLGRETLNWHIELPFVSPRSAYDGQKVSS